MIMKIKPVFFWTTALLLLVGLACLAYLGTFSRFIADDFCMAGDAIHLGLVEMLAKWYSSWTGRFMFILGTGLFGLAGPRFAGVLVILTIAFWCLGLAWAFLPLVRNAGWPNSRWLAFCAAALSLLVLFSSTPNLFQSVYWQDGLVNYSLPLVGLTFSGGILLRAWLQPIQRFPAILWIPALAFVSGGFTEAFSAMQVTLFLLALVLSLVFCERTARQRLVPLLVAGLLASLVAMLIVVVAPGNQVRLQAVGEEIAHPGLVRIITFSLRNMAHIFGKFFIQTPFWALVSILPPLLTGWLLSAPPKTLQAGWSLANLWKQSWVRGLIGISALALILVTAACAPVVYAMNAYPDDRTILVPQFVVVFSVISASALLGFGLRRQGMLHKLGESLTMTRLFQASILLILLVASGITVWQTVQQAPEFRAYAQSWDEKDALLRQAAQSGQSEITVTGGYGRFDVSDISTEPDYWVNGCMAYYYGLSRVRGE